MMYNLRSICSFSVTCCMSVDVEHVDTSTKHHHIIDLWSRTRNRRRSSSSVAGLNHNIARI